MQNRDLANMRIGIDARFLGPEGTGLGKYVQELILNLEKLDFQNQYYIFLRKSNFEEFKPENKNFKKILADVYWYSVKEQLELPLIFSAQKLDLLHVPHFNIPLFYSGKIIVTIHDLIKSEFATQAATTKSAPIYFFKHLAYEAIIRLAVRRAQKILVPSNYVSSKLRQKLKVPKEKIRVTYEASSLANLNLKTENSKQVLEKYNIKKPYLLYVGNAYPYKNLDNLLLALKQLTHNLKLVNPCSRSAFYDRLKDKAKSLGLKNHVILPGYVVDDDLTVLYKEAEAYVFPSLSEGFGIPGLDAMALGVPVICSDIQTFNEVYSDAVLYFNPRNPDDIAEKIKQVLENQNLKNELIQKGLNQSKKFSWQKMAKETLSIYNSQVTDN